MPEEPIILAPKEGTSFALGEAGFTIKADRRGPGFAFLALEGEFTEDTLVLPPHSHKETDEIFLVLEGEILYRVGEREGRAGPGAHAQRRAGQVAPLRGRGAGREGLAQLQAPQAPWPQTGAGASARPVMPPMTERSFRVSSAPHDGQAAPLASE